MRALLDCDVRSGPASLRRPPASLQKSCTSCSNTDCLITTDHLYAVCVRVCTCEYGAIGIWPREMRCLWIRKYRSLFNRPPLSADRVDGVLAWSRCRTMGSGLENSWAVVLVLRTARARRRRRLHPLLSPVRHSRALRRTRTTYFSCCISPHLASPQLPAVVGIEAERPLVWRPAGCSWHSPSRGRWESFLGFFLACGYGSGSATEDGARGSTTYCPVYKVWVRRYHRRPRSAQQMPPLSGEYSVRSEQLRRASYTVR